MSLQARAQAATAEFQRLQSELSEAVEARERLEAQLNENEQVKKVRSWVIGRNPNSYTILVGICEFDAK